MVDVLLLVIIVEYDALMHLLLKQTSSLTTSIRGKGPVEKNMISSRLTGQ